MRKAASPLFSVALLATIVGAVFVAMLAIEPGTLTLQWTDKDFANYWMAARLALEGRALDVFGPHESYLAHLRSFFGADYPWRAWSYPPHYLLLMLPLGLFAYKTALVLFLVTTFLLLCGALHLASRQIKLWQLLFLLPVIVTNGYVVQNGFLLSAFLIAGLALRDSRPVLAGICFGLLTVKPQLGVLLPLLFLWERQWLTITSAVVTTVALFLLSVAVFGIEAWAGFFHHVTPYQVHVMKELTGLFPHMMPTVFGAVRSLDFGASTALAVHLPFAVMALALFGFGLLRLGRPEARAANTVFATAMAMPYLVNYDLAALVASAVLWMDRERASLPSRCALFGLVCIPLLMPMLSLLGWPVAPVVILAAWLGLLDGDGVLPRLTRRPSPATT
jgi:arabinofuranan 3-O-arabinosyltransferase